LQITNIEEVDNVNKLRELGNIDTLDYRWVEKQSIMFYVLFYITMFHQTSVVWQIDDQVPKIKN